MVAGEIAAALLGVAATAALLALRKSKCFIRRIHPSASGLQWGIGFTDRPIVENELSIQALPALPEGGGSVDGDKNKD